MLGDSSSDQINESRYLQGPFPVEVQYSLKLDISKVAQDLSEVQKASLSFCTIKLCGCGNER